jgi:uncharacterized protein YndB with AHSA1/START domain
MPARNNAAAEAAERELVITRVFDAPRSLVFETWTKPEHMMRWWGPKGYTLPFCTMDFRAGGVYRFCMRSPEGRDYWVRGVYREIVEPERIVWTGGIEEEGKPGPETLMTVTFAEHQGKTRLTVHQTFSFESDHTRGADQGWTESLVRLAEYLSTVQPGGNDGH